MTSTTSDMNVNIGLEAEAMALLISLNKDLHSPNLSLQIQSIVRFTDLITEFPLPIIANSALLKLADVFKSCNNNFVRYWIVSVFEQVRGELLKVLNKDALVEKIADVLESNDPIARSLALRLLGQMAEILSDRIDLHHHIEKNLLTCIEGYERESCVVAIEQICSTSKSFASQILPQLEILINDIKTPPQAKLLLIKVLRHMHSDVKTVKKAFHLCTNDLLKNYPSTPFVLVILDTISQLAQNSVFIVKDTFLFLFDILKIDGRKRVKLTCLNNISKLSKLLSDTYTFDFPFDSLYNFLNQSPFESIKLNVLKLLASLSYSAFNVRKWFKYKQLTNTDNNLKIVHLVEHVLFHYNVQFVDLALEILINVIRYTDESFIEIQPLILNINNAICLSIHKRISLRNDLVYIKKLCEYIVRFIKAYPKNEDITKTIIKIMEQQSTNLSDSSNTYLIQCLVYLSKCLYKYSIYCPSIINQNVQKLTKIIISLCNVNNSNHNNNNIFINNLNNNHTQLYSKDELITQLCGTILRTISILKQNKLDDSIIELLYTNQNYWCLYCIAKEALFYRHFYLAESILSNLIKYVESETSLFWLQSLYSWSKAENLLMTANNNNNSIEEEQSRNVSMSSNNLFIKQENLEESLQYFDQSIIQLKASGISNCGFQLLCLRMRKKYVEYILNLILLLNNYQQQPLSTTTTNNMMDTKSDSDNNNYHSSSILYQNSFNQFIDLSEKYNDMINSFFDHINPTILKSSSFVCRILSKAISTIFIPHPLRNQKLHDTNFTHLLNNNNQDLKDPLLIQCNFILQQLQKFENNSKNNNLQNKIMIHFIIQSLNRIGFSVPSFYFTTVPNTILKLEMEINNQNILLNYNKPITSILGQGLVFKFSGYITYKKLLKRRVKAVCITIEQVNLSTTTATTAVATMNRKEQRFMIPVIENSFQKRCLCHFESEGRYQLVIKTQMIDQNDCYIWWNNNYQIQNYEMLNIREEDKKHVHLFVDVKPFQVTTTRLPLQH